MNKYIFILGLALFCSLSSFSQNMVSGVVKDSDGKPVRGVKIYQVGNPLVNTITDAFGEFSLVAEKEMLLEVNYHDALVSRIKVGEEENYTIILSDNNRVIDMGNAATDGIRLTQAVSSIVAEAIGNNSTQNLYDALYGLLPGLSVIQTNGWDNNSNLFVRGHGSLNGAAPLIVVDGFVRPMEAISLTEIESVSVLKDGAATALWGAQGANGVVLVTTKRGIYNRNIFTVDYNYGIGIPLNLPEFADGYNYALVRNEALQNDGLPVQYNQYALDALKSGSHPDLFPNTDWLKEGLRSHTSQQQFDFTMRGGGSKLRYYTLLGYKNDMGIFNEEYTHYNDRYNSQMKKYNLNLRTNLDIDLTSSTLVKLSMLGMLRQTKRPYNTANEIFTRIFNTPSAAFPVKTSNGKWGSNSIYSYNPIADIADAGYNKQDQRMLQSDLRIIQDLSVYVKGLRVEGAVAYDNNAVYREIGKRGVNDTDLGYEYEIFTPLYDYTGQIIDSKSEVLGKNEELNITNGGLASQYIRATLEGKVSHTYAGKGHHLNSYVLYRQESDKPTGRNNLRKRQYVVGSVGYQYDNRYMVDVLVNHYGTSVLSKGDRFRTYPAVSAAWIVSNEPFMRSMEAIDMLKLRASWGRSGYDGIGYELDKQYWTTGGNYFYQDGNVSTAGIVEGRLGMSRVEIEQADKYNVGIDLQMSKGMYLTVDGFYDNRTNILLEESGTISSVLGVAFPATNEGHVITKGVESSLTWKKSYKDFNYYATGNFSFVKSDVRENGEGYKPSPRLSAKGHTIGTVFGLEAIGYFRDEQDIADSPRQMFSEVRPGDVKYRDMNNDGQIDNDDRMVIGFSSLIPEIYYGIQLGLEYKDFGIDMLFQGAALYSKMLNVNSLYWPLANNTNISQWYLNDKIRWTPDTKDVANVPRLTTLDNANNFRNSTQWLVDGSYLKLRNLNIYYNLPKQWVNNFGVENLQVYIRGNNIFSLDKVKYMNSENLGVNYPDLTTFFFGVNIKF